MSLIPKKGTVYVVDDDEAVRDSLQWLLEAKITVFGALILLNHF